MAFLRPHAIFQNFELASTLASEQTHNMAKTATKTKPTHNAASMKPATPDGLQDQGYPDVENDMRRSSMVRILCVATLAWFCGFIPASYAFAETFIVGTNEDFSAVGKAVVELFQKRDTHRFAVALAPAKEDWLAALAAKNASEKSNDLKDIQDAIDHQRQILEENARNLLSVADGGHWDFSTGRVTAQVVPPQFIFKGPLQCPGLKTEDARLPLCKKAQVVVSVDAGATNGAPGNFVVIVSARGLFKFPAGWRCLGNVDFWVRVFPNSVYIKASTDRLVDEARMEMRFQGLTDQEDPDLLKLGEALAHFVRERDVSHYKQESLIDSNRLWELTQMASDSKPTRAEFDKMWNDGLPDWTAAAQSVVRQMEDFGLDLKDAVIQVKQATVRQAQISDNINSVSGQILEGERLQVELSVKSRKMARNGKSLAGDYTLAVDEVLRTENGWKIMGKVTWVKFPEGVVDERTETEMQLDAYGAEHGTLPLGISAPDIEFIRLDNGQKMKLSGLRGKVVVLDFWATDCGACQEPLSQLQGLPQQNPDWKDRVALVSLSIDDSLKKARDHLDKHNWTNTFNVWAGDGQFDSPPAKSFKVGGIPVDYIIDETGKIIKAGHPVGLDIPAEVNLLLSQTKKRK